MTRVAVAGAGWAGEVHIAALERVAGAKLVQVVSRTTESAERTAATVGVPAGTYAELSSKAEVVVIATPPTHHLEMSLAALERKRSILVEKPLCATLGEADALIASAQSAAEPGEAVLMIHEDTLVGWRLLKGKRLTAEEYAKLRDEEQKEEAYRAALGMLERKARTTAELARALKRKGFSQEAIEGCVERLRTNRMVDDSAFARRFAEQRAANQRKGRMLIRQELLQRGVAKPEIEQAIGAIEPEIEQQSALALARKKWPSVKGNDRERKQKLMAMLMRRGYTGSVARSAAQQAASEADDGRKGNEDAEWDDNVYDESFE